MAHASAYFCSSLYKYLVLAGQTKQKTNELQRLLLMQLASGKEGDMRTLPLLACFHLFLEFVCMPVTQQQTPDKMGSKACHVSTATTPHADAMNTPL